MKPYQYCFLFLLLGQALPAFSQIKSLIFIGQDKYGHTHVYTEDGSPLYNYRIDGRWADATEDSVLYLTPSESGWDTVDSYERPVYPYSFYLQPGSDAKPYRIVSRFENMFPGRFTISSTALKNMEVIFTVKPRGNKKIRIKPRLDTFYSYYLDYKSIGTMGGWTNMYFPDENKRYYQKEIRDENGRLLQLVSGYGDHEKDTTISEDLRSAVCSYRFHFNKKGHITLIEGVGSPFPEHFFNREYFPWSGPKHYHRYVYDKQGRLIYIISSFGHRTLKETKALSLDYLSLIRRIGQNCNPDEDPWDWPGVDNYSLNRLDSADLADLLKGKSKMVEGTLLAEPDSVLSAEDREIKKLLMKNLRSEVFWALHQPQVVEFTYGKFGVVTARMYNEERVITVLDSVVYDKLGRPVELHIGSCPSGDERQIVRYIYDSQGRLIERTGEYYTLQDKYIPEQRHWEVESGKEMYRYDEKGRIIGIATQYGADETINVECRFVYLAH
jgi:hypothetical protein